jgi:hypothetical protein
MTDNKDIKAPVEHTPSPFISQNVWLKRLGLLLLISGLGFGTYPFLTAIVIVLAIVTYFIKQIKGFFKSIWNS